MSSIDYYKKTYQQIYVYIFFMSIVGVGLTALCYALLTSFIHIRQEYSLVAAAVIGGVFSILGSALATKYVSSPLLEIQKAVLHVSTEHNNIGPPQIDKLQVGKDFVATLSQAVYQIAAKSVPNSEQLAMQRGQISQAVNIVNRLPIPLLVINNQYFITNANDATLAYCGVESSALFGKKLSDNIDLEFSSEPTLETWMEDCTKNKATDTTYWRRVRVAQPNGQAFRQCDIAGYYSRNNSSGTEFIITLFDRTKQYEQEENELSFVSLAVHELRTPLTITRGYVEVLEEELADKLDPNMKLYLQKLTASTQQLSAFVNNILNMAHIEENELNFNLSSENWADVLQNAVADMQLRAKVRNKTITLEIAKDLPAVGIDGTSIAEVIFNLLDNAIKYSGESSNIEVVSSLNTDGLVETSIIDHGLGIPTSVAPSLFEKYARNHRNKRQVSGTGLGLFLSKAIIAAHGGNIWLSSKEGEGSTFRFTVLPFDKLGASATDSNNGQITRSAHGWIKNHSMYRR